MQLSEVVLLLLQAVADEFMPRCHECVRAWVAWLQRSKARFFALFAALAVFVLLIASAPRRSRVRLQREHRPPGLAPRRACFVLDDARVERGLLVTYVQLMQAFARELDGELSVLSLGPRPGQLSAQQWLKQRRVPTSGLLWQSLPPSTHTYDGGAAATVRFGFGFGLRFGFARPKPSPSPSQASYLALEWLRLTRTRTRTRTRTQTQTRALTRRRTWRSSGCGSCSRSATCWPSTAPEARPTTRYSRGLRWGSG